uniref:Uncharacterized protein n=1 Tax=viral metagenome TaxID=1070528 RepID=A0A6C0KIX7_9ZZZZ
MNSEYIILGNKKYNNIDLNHIIDIFKHNIRCNISLPTNNNGTIIDYYMLNCHIYAYLLEEKYLKTKNEFINKYKDTCYEKNLADYFDFFQKNKHKIKILKQPQTNYNNFLINIKSPYLFDKIPSCGFNCILELLLKNVKPYVFGMGLDTNDKNSYYNKDNEITNQQNNSVLSCHCYENEIKLLKWFHMNNYVDATMCLLKDYQLPTFDCKYFSLKSNILLLFLKEYGICILENYYDEEILNNLIIEYHKIFENYKDKIQFCNGDDGEEGEPRIFNVEKYSEFIKNNFSNNTLFNNIVLDYTKQKLYNKKTLINKLIYKDSKQSNSGGGWHRDAHNMQFKTIMYLSDVTSKNGNFQFITNSSQKHIGNPTPRNENYNTRYHNDTINKLLETNKNCNKYDIIGKKGTIIIVDTTYIHRGKNIEEGERFAMTEYYI